MTQPPRPIKKHIPFILLILALLTFGLTTFRTYGLSWDEPLFYDYGEALGYAYTPANWFRPDFDLNNAYGSSGTDHKNRGPAYLVLARTPVHALESLGLDSPSAWHLVNFLTFLLGVTFLYRLSLRWMGEWAAFGVAALFSTQPLLLGHAFINPKDMPFLVFFAGALLFGFEMVDALNDKTKSVKRKMLGVLVAAFFLGIATSIRVLAPLAGILVVIYAIAQYATRNKTDRLTLSSFIFHLSSFTILSILIMFATWPYLWESPLHNFFQVFLFMSENPTGLQVLFNGEVYRAFELPRRYLPTFLALTLTEPVWPLFLLGLATAAWKTITTIRQHRSTKTTIEYQPITNYQLLNTEHWPLTTDYWLLITAFIIPFAYVIAIQPPMYDGFRHFLFIVPPVFVTCGLGLEAIFQWIKRATGVANRPRIGREYSNGRVPIRLFVKNSWPELLVILALLAPNLLAIANLHPFEYTYYNSFIGGTGGAFRTYETDYWLTCYKQAVEGFNPAHPNATLYVHREAYIAATYAAPGLTVREERGNMSLIRPGDFILVNSRTDEDRKTFHDAPVVLAIGRDGATFCEIKQIP
jgi:hypothetical protein